MFSSFFSSNLPKLSFGWNTAQAIGIPAVKVYDVETSPDKRDRRLKHLLKLNHANFSILWNHHRFHNHTPHLLGSAYILGGTADHLNAVYEHAVSEGHEGWVDSPSEIALHDYRDFLGKRDYQRAWVDFFEDQLVDNSFDWKQVAAKFLFERGPKGSPNAYPMFSCLTAGLGHPLIHLGYAYELASREVGMEALGLAATCYDPKLAALLEEGKATPSYHTTDPFEVLDHLHNDKRLDSCFEKPGDDNLERLLDDEKLRSILLEHFHAWDLKEPKAAFEASQRLGTALLISTTAAAPINGHGYDFFILHLLTTSHAVRILISFIPKEYHVSLLREWWLITLALYIAQLRPKVTVQQVLDYNIPEGESWESATKRALEGKHNLDEHYVKGVRAIKEAAAVWGDKDGFFEKAAVRFSIEFGSWF